MSSPGLPDVDSLATYGGAKVDESPVADSSTDESAVNINLLKMNVAGMTQTSDRAWVRFIGNATTPTDPASNVHGSVWGNVVGVKPVVTRDSLGNYDVTWPATVTDELGAVHTVNLRAVSGVVVEGATLFLWTATPTGPNTVRIRIFTTAFAATDAVGTTFFVSVR